MQALVHAASVSVGLYVENNHIKSMKILERVGEKTEPCVAGTAHTNKMLLSNWLRGFL